MGRKEQQQGHRSLFIEKSKSWSYEARFGKDDAGGMDGKTKQSFGAKNVTPPPRLR
jgi:hypothetical protein